MVYKCEICETEFKRKDYLDKHLNRKTKCFKKEINKELQCEKCNKIFSRKDALIRHEKTKCYKKNNDKDIKLENDDETKSDNTAKNIINNNLTNTTVETINNTINDNSTNIVNHIHINGFTFENTSYITPDVIADLLKKHGHLANSEYIKLKHINPEHKENMNIQFVSITNYSYMLFKCYDEWIPIDSKHLLASLDHHSLINMKNSIKDTNIPNKEKHLNELETLLNFRLNKEDETKHIIKENKDNIKDALIKHHKTITKNKKEYKRNKHKINSDNK